MWDLGSHALLLCCLSISPACSGKGGPAKSCSMATSSQPLPLAELTVLIQSQKIGSNPKSIRVENHHQI